MAENDVNYLKNNNIQCNIEKDGVNERALVSVDPQISSTLTLSKDGIVIAPYASDAVLRKQAYSIRQVFTILTGATKTLIFDPTTLGNDVILEPFRVSSTVGTVKMNLIADVKIDSGDSELPVVNRYGLLDFPIHKMGCFDTFTNLDRGSQPPSEYIVGSKSTNQSSGGGSTAGANIFTFENDKKYLLEWVNNTGEEVDVSLQFDWFEV